LGAEVRAALYQAKASVEAVNYFYGLGGRDITVEDFEQIYEKLEVIGETHEVTDMYDYIGLREK
jgi:pyruvate ferredoxin oxidoreductase alpha subunit